jgi:hypothetical protein
VVLELIGGELRLFAANLLIAPLPHRHVNVDEKPGLERTLNPIHDSQ